MTDVNVDSRNSTGTIIHANFLGYGRDYQIWLYSDHGQQANTPYEYKHGRTLDQVVATIFQQEKRNDRPSAEDQKSGWMRGVQTQRAGWMGGFRAKRLEQLAETLANVGQDGADERPMVVDLELPHVSPSQSL